MEGRCVILKEGCFRVSDLHFEEGGDASTSPKRG